LVNAELFLGDAVSLTRVLRQDIAPVGSAYLVFLVVFIWYATRRRRGTPLPRQRSVEVPVRWTAALRLVVPTVAGAYLVFTLIIAIFYLVLGGQPRNFVPQALAQGSVLAFGIVLPAFVLLTWAEAGLRRRRAIGRGRHGTDVRPSE
jgi:membrane protease YdiL (CAAX protease family)